MTQSAESAVVCANPDCRVAETGKCVEGLELNACPHFGRVPLESADSDEHLQQQPEEAIADSVHLPVAETLSVGEAAEILRDRNARVIAIIGAHEAGKTSLIASLYDKLQEGPLLGMNYARSSTLHGFELVCHDARAASQQATPHSPHTPLGEVRFYDLQLAGGPLKSITALLLADRAGEEYRSLADDHSNAQSYPELARADSLTVLIDGKRLLDAGDRHNLRSEITLVLQALIESGAAHEQQRLGLVLTKLDLLQSSPDPAEAAQHFHRLCAHIEHLFAANFSIIETFETAASPKTGAVKRGTGIPELLAFWMEPAPSANTDIPMPPSSTRAFYRLQHALEAVSANE